MMREVKSLFFFILIGLLLFCGAVKAGAAETTVINIRNWAAPDHTRVVIDATEDPTYTFKKEDRKLLLELEEATFSKTLKRQILLRKPGIDRITVTVKPDNRVLIEMLLTEHVQTKVFKLNPVEDKPYRIVVDIILPEEEKKASEERALVKVTLKKKIVVIDPGHGGDDPGAVGRMGTREKVVVLAISKKIQDILNKKEGYRAFLTREGDYYVPFRKRLKIAREYHADLFLSIHADAERTRTAMGSSVYALTLKSASSEAARILARNENLADIVGGEANGDASKEETDTIILNMLQTNTRNSSKILGNMLLTNLGTVHRIKFATVQEAPFMVLKLPEVPSVLIETAFLSNRRDEKLLRSPKFQKEIAQSIADTAVEYLSHTPKEVPPVVLTRKEDLPKAEKDDVDDRKPSVNAAKAADAPPKQKPVEIVYRVKRGDSLGKIAQKYGTTVSAIARLNDVRVGKPLYVNLKLRIPAPVDDDAGQASRDDEKNAAEAASEKAKKSASVREKTDEGKTAYKLYTVKKGETLDSIAAKKKTTLAVLLKLNDMKLKDKLFAGRKIRIPAPAAAKESRTVAKKGKKRMAEDRQETADADEAEKIKAISEKAKKKTGAKGNAGEEKGKAGYRLYTVKKGESLDGIAEKNGTTLAILLKLNDMQMKDKLLAGRKIKVPATDSAEDAKAEAKKGKERAEDDSPQDAKSEEKASGKAASSRKAIGSKVKAGDEDGGYKYYVVKKGDSLDGIAAKNGTTLAVLLKMNQMKMKDPLLSGRKIKIPVAEAEEDVKPEVRKGPEKKQRNSKKKNAYYTVKKGDTLDIIARKHRTNIATLKKMNPTKKLSPLYADQRLAVPARQ